MGLKNEKYGNYSAYSRISHIKGSSNECDYSTERDYRAMCDYCTKPDYVARRDNCDCCAKCDRNVRCDRCDYVTGSVT